MRSTLHQQRILTGSISKNVGLGDGSNLAKFHAFIIKANNSGYFWTITAGLKSNLVIFPGVGASEQLFGPVRGEFEQNFPKI